MFEKLKLKWKQYRCYHYNKQPEGEYAMKGYSSYPIKFYYCPDCGLHFTTETPIPNYVGGW